MPASALARLPRARRDHTARYARRRQVGFAATLRRRGRRHPTRLTPPRRKHGHAARNDRPRSHGGQHRAPPDARRPRVRRLRRQRGRDRAARERGRDRCPLAGRVRGQAHGAARGLDHGARGHHGRDGRRARCALRARRHRDRRRQQLLPRRRRSRRGAQGARHPLRRRRHERRRLRAGARLLHDDRRRGPHRPPPRPDLPHARAGRRDGAAHAGAPRPCRRSPSTATCTAAGTVRGTS